MECDICKKSKKDVSIREDPYAKDVGNCSVYRELCDDCEHELVMDI